MSFECCCVNHTHCKQCLRSIGRNVLASNLWKNRAYYKKNNESKCNTNHHQHYDFSTTKLLLHLNDALNSTLMNSNLEEIFFLMLESSNEEKYSD